MTRNLIASLLKLDNFISTINLISIRLLIIIPIIIDQNHI
jgi:hypothetical protein